MDAVNKYLKETLNETPSMFGGTIQGIRPPVKCKDGFSISVQASSGHYCSPRVNGDVIYDDVELGFPNMEDELIAKYAEDPDEPTNTVYGYVPVDIVNQLIEKHGGIVCDQKEELA